MAGRRRCPSPPAEALPQLEKYCSGFLCTYIDGEGRLQGTDLEWFRSLRAVTNSPSRRRAGLRRILRLTRWTRWEWMPRWGCRSTGNLSGVFYRTPAGPTVIRVSPHAEGLVRWRRREAPVRELLTVASRVPSSRFPRARWSKSAGRFRRSPGLRSISADSEASPPRRSASHLGRESRFALSPIAHIPYTD